MMFHPDVIQIVSSYSSFLSSEFMHKNPLDLELLQSMFLDIESNGVRKSRIIICSLSYFKFLDVKQDDVCVHIVDK